jgi:hypothetical protein
MRFLILLLTISIIAASGCKPRPGNAVASTKGSSGGGDPVLGAVQNVRKAVQRTVTSVELDALRIYINEYSLANDRMPPKEEIIAAVSKSGDRKLREALEQGLIVLTGAKSRDGVWAYEKDAPTNGGMVLTSQGIERLSAEELKQRLAGS